MRAPKLDRTLDWYVESRIARHVAQGRRTALLMVAMIALVILVVAMRWDGPLKYVLWAFPLIWIASSVFENRWMKQRFWERVDRVLDHEQDAPCVKCMYPVDCRGEPATCNECGQTYNGSRLRSAWEAGREKASLTLRRPPPGFARGRSQVELETRELVRQRCAANARTNAVIVGTGFAIATVIFAILHGTFGRPSRWLAAPLMLPFAIVAAIHDKAFRGRVRAILDRGEYSPCPNCWLPLGMSDTPGLCPQCNTMLHSRVLRESWLAFVGNPTNSANKRSTGRNAA